jgi:hypothetical protein
VERHGAVLDRRLAAAVMPLDDDLEALQPLERIARTQQRTMIGSPFWAANKINTLAMKLAGAAGFAAGFFGS